MKKSKRLLALLLSVMLIMGAVMSVPFTANAENVVLEETGVYSLKFNTLNILGGKVVIGNDYYSVSDPEAKSDTPLYAWFDAEEAGYYVLSVKNNHMTEGDKELTIGIADLKDNDCGTISLADGEEKELSIKIEEPTRYYIKLCYTFEQVCYGGNIDLKLTSFADAEPDESSNKIIVKPAVYADGSIDVKGDKDWFFVQTADNKKYSITLENRNEEATAFKAEVYDTKGDLIGTVTTETEKTVTLELPKPSDVVSYNVCVTGLNDDSLGKYGFMMNEVKPVATEVPLNEEYYDSIAKPGAEGSVDYLKFTTIDKDAYYTISVKNINIVTHTWSDDIEVQADILNANDEVLSNINLTEGQEKSTTLKLAPNTTYYMKVYNNYWGDTNGGNYKVQITYVLDPDKNEMENATEWQLEDKYFGNIAARGDSDWFKVTTNEETDYTFTLKNVNIETHSWSNDLKFRGVIYNDKSESVTSILLGSGGEGSERITLDPNTTYYIAIWDPQGTTGEYSFDLSVTVIIDEEAVGMANAIEIPYDEDYYDSITSWDEGNRTDYLKFTTLSEPAYYTLTAKNINIPTHSWSSDYQVQVRVWNEHKEELGKICLGPESEHSVTLRLDENTTYYIRINNNENNGGNYKVNLTYILDPESNVMESGNTLRIGERYYGNIAARGDTDYFAITTGEETEYTLLLKNINISTHSWSSDLQFRAVLYNKYSEELGKILLTSGREGTLKLTLDPNTTYYIGVWDPEGTMGDYNVLLAESMILGDTNLDGNVKIQDATLIQKALAKLATLDSKQNTLADATEDGKVNIKDATAIQKYLAKIDTGFRVGELILVEEEFSEPATEAPEVTTTASMEPVSTTSDINETTVATVATSTVAIEPPEVSVTTTVTVEPTEVPVTTTVTAEPTEVPVTTAADTEATTAATEPLSQLDTLKALNREVYEFLDEYAEYADELPLSENSEELQRKEELGYATGAEGAVISEYEKLYRINDRVSYYLGFGYQFVEDHSEYIDMLSKEYEWFRYYVTEVHPTPSGKVIYFDNTIGWSNIYVYYWSEESGEEGKLWPGDEMIFYPYGDVGVYLYYLEIPTGYDHIMFNSTENSSYCSVEIDLSQHTDTNGFRLLDDYNSGFNYETFKYAPLRPVY